MRKTSVAVSALALALALGACSQEKGVGTGEANSTNVIAAPGGDGAFDTAQSLADAVTDGAQKAKSAKFTVEGSAAGQRIIGSGEGSFDGVNTRMSVTMESTAGLLEMRMIGATIYLKTSKSSPGTETSKPWLKMDLSGMPGIGDSLERSDPTTSLQTLQEAGAKITRTEKSEVDGQPAIHYSLEVDTKAYLATLGDTAANAGTGGLPEKMPVDVYINAQSLPVKFEMDLGGQGKMTVHYTDWGTPVNVEEPPADQVGEMSTGAGGAGTQPAK